MVRRSNQEKPEEFARRTVGWSVYDGITLELDEDVGLRLPATDAARTFRCLWSDGVFVCERPAGRGTPHAGVGMCKVHGGRRGRAEGAWLMAHLIAREQDISPWEALLLVVRRAAAWAYFYETKLAQVDAGDDEALRPGGSAYDWVLASERVNDKLARYAKMAVDAGVAAMLVQQARNDGAQIAQVLNSALGAAELTVEQEIRVRTALRDALLSIEAGGT